MPTLPDVAKVVRLEHHFSQGADANLMVREFFSYSGTLSLADAQTWLGTMAGAMQTFVSTNLSNTLTLYLSRLTDLTTVSSPQVEDTTTQTGGVSTAALAAGVATVISKHITRRFRGGHSRTYIPGMVVASLLTPNQWTGAWVSGIKTQYDAYITTITSTVPSAAGTGHHVAVSYYHGFTVSAPPGQRAKNIPTPRATPLVENIVSTSTNPRPASQRRRNETP